MIHPAVLSVARRTDHRRQSLLFRTCRILVLSYFCFIDRHLTPAGPNRYLRCALIGNALGCSASPVRGRSAGALESAAMACSSSDTLGSAAVILISRFMKSHSMAFSISSFFEWFSHCSTRYVTEVLPTSSARLSRSSSVLGVAHGGIRDGLVTRLLLIYF